MYDYDVKDIMDITKAFLSVVSRIEGMNFDKSCKNDPSKDPLDDPNIIDVEYREV